MTPAETSRLYAQACKARRMQPEQEEGRHWHQVLRGFEFQDVKAALELWDADATANHNGEPRGKWIPTPAELKPICQSVEARRVARSREPQDMLLWQCTGQRRHRWSAFVVRSMVIYPKGRKCSQCEASVLLIERQPA